MAHTSVRLSSDLQAKIARAVKEGFSSTRTEFIRVAIQEKLARSESDTRFQEMEERVASTLARVADRVADRLADENRKLAQAQQAAIAMLSSLAKTILSDENYDRFMDAAADELRGPFVKSMTEVLQ
jgi:Arc/MetJ-type ribon-helix-helix transcriptional regulator